MVARKITSYSENDCKLYTAFSMLEIDIGDEVVGDKLAMLVTDLAD